MSKGKQFVTLLLAVSLLMTGSAVAFAQAKLSDPPAQAKPSPATAASTAAPVMAPVASKSAAPPQPVSRGQAVYLVRSTLMMLNDANRSGNYTVLRDLAAPDFQARNSAADLAQAFSDLRRRKFDFFAVSFASPQFPADPTVGPDGTVRLTGFFPTQPLQIRFDLIFQAVAGEWRLAGISVATPEAPKQQSQLSPPRPANRMKPYYGLRLYQGVAGIRW